MEEHEKSFDISSLFIVEDLHESFCGIMKKKLFCLNDITFKDCIIFRKIADDEGICEDDFFCAMDGQIVTTCKNIARVWSESGQSVTERLLPI